MNKEHQSFLDKLRADGIINPFDMTPLVKKEFNLDYIKASDIVFEWVTTEKKVELPTEVFKTNEHQTN